MMIQEEAKNQREDMIKETCFQFLCEALFLTVIKKKICQGKKHKRLSEILLEVH